MNTFSSTKKTQSKAPPPTNTKQPNKIEDMLRFQDITILSGGGGAPKNKYMSKLVNSPSKMASENNKPSSLISIRYMYSRFIKSAAFFSLGHRISSAAYPLYTVVF